MNNLILKNAIQDFDLFNFLDECKEEEEDFDYSTENKNVGPGWVGISPCPYPNCNDTRFHGALNIDNKSYNCWSCGHTASLIGFICKIKKISYKRAINFIIDSFEFDEEDIEKQIYNIFNTVDKSITNDEKFIKINLPESKLISSFIIKNNPIINKFFKDRKLTLNHVYEYNLKIGINNIEKGHLIIPITHNKKLVAYQTRAITHKLYKNIGPIKNYIYNYDQILNNKVIIIVEGFFDFVKTKDFLYKFFKNKYETTTGFSKILTNNQIKLIQSKNPQKLIYLLDNDAWFDYDKTCHQLICPTDYMILPNGKDPGNMTEKEFLQLCIENKL